LLLNARHQSILRCHWRNPVFNEAPLKFGFPRVVDGQISGISWRIHVLAVVEKAMGRISSLVPPEQETPPLRGHRERACRASLGGMLLSSFRRRERILPASEGASDAARASMQEGGVVRNLPSAARTYSVRGGGTRRA
jgi:hypothetical protein